MSSSPIVECEVAQNQAWHIYRMLNLTEWVAAVGAVIVGIC